MFGRSPLQSTRYLVGLNVGMDMYMGVAVRPPARSNCIRYLKVALHQISFSASIPLPSSRIYRREYEHQQTFHSCTSCQAPPPLFLSLGQTGALALPLSKLLLPIARTTSPF